MSGVEGYNIVMAEEVGAERKDGPAFRGEMYFMSSMYPLDKPLFLPDGTSIEVAALENSYQAAQFVHEEDAHKVLISHSGFASKSLANRLKRRGAQVREDWPEQKLEVMERLQRAKFEDEELLEKLLATAGTEIVELNPWHDTFWGVDSTTGEGRNELGKILMKIRDEKLGIREPDEPQADQ